MSDIFVIETMRRLLIEKTADSDWGGKIAGVELAEIAWRWATMTTNSAFGIGSVKREHIDEFIFTRQQPCGYLTSQK